MYYIWLILVLLYLISQPLITLTTLELTTSKPPFNNITTNTFILHFLFSQYNLFYILSLVIKQLSIVSLTVFIFHDDNGIFCYVILIELKLYLILPLYLLLVFVVFQGLLCYHHELAQQ